MRRTDAKIVFCVTILALLAMPAGVTAQDRLSDVGFQLTPNRSMSSGGPAGRAELKPTAASTEVLATVYTNRATFDAAFPGLPIEDWEDFIDGTVLGCDAPANNGTSCTGGYNVGDILPGLEIDCAANSGPGLGGLVIIPTGFDGNDSIEFGSNFYADNTIINLDPPVDAVGFDIACHFGSPQVDILVFDGAGTQIWAGNYSPCVPTGAFVGWSADVPEGIGRIELNDPSGASVEHIDDVAFGDVAGPGSVLTSWPSGLVATWGVAFDGLDGTVWASSPGVNWGGTATMYEYSPAGAPTGRTHPYVWGPDNGPADMTFNRNTGTIWLMNIASGVSNCLYEMDPATGFTGQTVCPGGPAGWVTSQRGVAYDPTTDTFYAGGWNEGLIYHIDMAGNDVEPPVNVGLLISGMAYNPETQHLFVMVNASPTEIFVFDTSAGYTLVGQFGISQDFGANAGAGLDIDCEGKLWAVDQNTQGVYQIDSGETASLCMSIFADGFESGDTSVWSNTVP
jgi:hypothetical protein